MADMVRYARATDIVATEVDGTAVLLNTQSWVYLDFDRVGTAIWDLLETPQTMPALVAALTAKFKVDEATCAADTKAFLDDMVAQGAVTAS